MTSNTESHDPHRKLRNKISAKISDPTSTISTELAAAVHADLTSHEQTIERACDPQGHIRLVLDVLERERVKYQADDPSEHKYDGNREQPLCTCTDPYCTIKKGEVPHEMKQAESFEEGEREFRESHGGDPLVLKHAYDEYVDVRSDAMETLRRNWMALQHEVHPNEIADVAAMDKDELAQTIDGGNSPVAGD